MVGDTIVPAERGVVVSITCADSPAESLTNTPLRGDSIAILSLCKTVSMSFSVESPIIVSGSPLLFSIEIESESSVLFSMEVMSVSPLPFSIRFVSESSLSFSIDVVPG